MPGKSSTARRADLFDSLTEEGRLCLTCLTAVSWHEAKEQVDQILWHLADNGSRDATLAEFSISGQTLDAILERADDPELASIPDA